MERYEEILQFWFGNIDEDTVIAKGGTLSQRWFGKNKNFDAEIKKNFEADLNRAAVGKLKEWEESPRGRLALIILLDQFPRNIYRNTVKAFDYDLQALEHCLVAIKRKQDDQLNLLVERQFLYMPMMHSENSIVQEQSLQYFKLLAEEAERFEPQNVEYFQYTLGYAQRHYDAIKQFQRFPHRNKILKRKSTSGERSFLESPGSSF